MATDSDGFWQPSHTRCSENGWYTSWSATPSGLWNTMVFNISNDHICSYIVSSMRQPTLKHPEKYTEISLGIASIHHRVRFRDPSNPPTFIRWVQSSLWHLFRFTGSPSCSRTLNIGAYTNNITCSSSLWDAYPKLGKAQRIATIPLWIYWCWHKEDSWIPFAVMQDADICVFSW